MAVKRLQGEIVSDKMNKTRVVRVTVLKTHPKYHKQYTIYKRFKAHDENGEYHAGDVVEIEETRPLAAGKSWKITRKVK